jgi:hypothetical protein
MIEGIAGRSYPEKNPVGNDITYWNFIIYLLIPSLFMPRVLYPHPEISQVHR